LVSRKRLQRKYPEETSAIHRISALKSLGTAPGTSLPRNTSICAKPKLGQRKPTGRDVERYSRNDFSAEIALLRMQAIRKKHPTSSSHPRSNSVTKS
jgi:hypothetical protein